VLPERREDRLAANARACNDRLMDAVIADQGSGILANPVIERPP
jgi:hypothetical protein